MSYNVNELMEFISDLLLISVDFENIINCGNNCNNLSVNKD